MNMIVTKRRIWISACMAFHMCQDDPSLPKLERCRLTFSPHDAKHRKEIKLRSPCIDFGSPPERNSPASGGLRLGSLEEIRCCHFDHWSKH